MTKDIFDKLSYSDKLHFNILKMYKYFIYCIIKSSICMAILIF